MDMLAEKMGIDPLEFRRRNSLAAGPDQGHRPRRHGRWPFPELCDAIRPHYERAKQETRRRTRAGPSGAASAWGAARFGIGSPATRRSWRSSSTRTTA